MPGLHPLDLDLINKMLEAQLLENIKLEKLLQVSEVTGVITCSDCYQREDMNKHWNNLFDKLGKNPLLHISKLNGLPLRLVKSCVTEKHQEHLMMLDEIADSMALGRIEKTLKIVGHIPCGKATKHGLSLYDTIELYVQSRIYLSEEFPELDISCYVHVDFTSMDIERGKKTFHLDTSKWDLYKEEFVKYDHTKSALGLWAKA